MGRPRTLVIAPKTVTSICEPLEGRRLFAANTLALVHQELHRPPSAYVADIDGDEVDDTVVPTTCLAADGGLAVGFDVYRNDGKGTMRWVGSTDCNDGGTRTVRQAEVVVAHLNGDGALDVAMKLFSVTGQPTPVGEAQTLQAQLVIFHGDGKGGFEQQRGTFILPHVLETRSNARHWSNDPYVEDAMRTLAAADLNGDKVAEVISWAGNDVVVYGSGKVIAHQQALFNPKEYSRILAVCDTDGDGHNDELLAAVDGRLQYASFNFSSDGTTTVRVSKIDALTVKQGVRVAVGDVDGDGFSDLVVMDKQRVTVGLNGHLSGGGIQFTPLGRPLGVNPAIVLIGDVDGDGKDDLFTVAYKKHTYTGHVTVIK